MTAIAIKSRQVLRAGKDLLTPLNRFICSRACFWSLVLPAVQHTTQTLYNFWFALWLVAKVTFTLSKMNGNITRKEQNKSKHVQGTKQSGLQCFKWHSWHLMSQNDTKRAVSSTRCSAFRVLAITLAHSLKLPRTVSKLKKSR